MRGHTAPQGARASVGCWDRRHDGCGCRWSGWGRRRRQSWPRHCDGRGCTRGGYCAVWSATGWSTRSAGRGWRQADRQSRSCWTPQPYGWVLAGCWLSGNAATSTSERSGRRGASMRPLPRQWLMWPMVVRPGGRDHRCHSCCCGVAADRRTRGRWASVDRASQRRERRQLTAWSPTAGQIGARSLRERRGQRADPPATVRRSGGRGDAPRRQPSEPRCPCRAAADGAAGRGRELGGAAGPGPLRLGRPTAGVQLVTVWQDLAQIEDRYGPRARTIVNNHQAKVGSGARRTHSANIPREMRNDWEIAGMTGK